MRLNIRVTYFDIFESGDLLSIGGLPVHIRIEVLDEKPGISFRAISREDRDDSTTWNLLLCQFIFSKLYVEIV
jgi:hypothetical protein